MELKNKLFTERFRPTTIDDIVLLDRVKKQIQNGLKTNILMASSPGRGKTSLSYILSKQDDMPYLYINASRETSIDTIRDRVVNWCTQPSLLHDYHKLKVVIMDEFEAFSTNAMNALKGTIEEFTNEARFIATTNYIDKVPEAIRSRFTEINLEPETYEEEKELKVKYYQKAASIVKELQMKTDKDGIIKLTDNYFPDLRALVNGIERLYLEGKTEFYASDIKKYDTNYKELFDKIINGENSVKLYQLMNGEYAKQLDAVLISLGNDFIEYIRENKPNLIQSIPQIIITVADHQYKSKFTIDKLVNVLAAIYSIQESIK